jgi:hypothetical protein
LGETDGEMLRLFARKRRLVDMGGLDDVGHDPDLDQQVEPPG